MNLFWRFPQREPMLANIKEAVQHETVDIG